MSMNMHKPLLFWQDIMKYSSFLFQGLIIRLKHLQNKLTVDHFTNVKKNIIKLKKRHDIINTKPYCPSNSMSIKPDTTQQSFIDEAIEFVKSMFSAMILAMIIRTFLLQPFSIPSESMLPNLYVGDYLFVSKYAYGYSKYSMPFAPNIFDGRIFSSEPKRGDVVVFRVEDDQNKDYIKRLIGLPGDRIRFEKGSVIINGKPALIGLNGKFGTDTIDYETVGAQVLTEEIDGKKYDTLDVFDSPFDNTGDYIVPPEHYFFAGDNRDNSQDSRFSNGPVRFVHRDKLIGKALFTFFSIRDAHFFEFWKWPTNIRFDRIFKEII